MEGSGRMVVTAVGINSQSGIIFALLGAAEDEDNAQKKQRKKASSAAGTNSSTQPELIPLNQPNYNPASHDGADAANTQGKEAADGGGTVEAPRQEKSVLQAKLTKLAIQIGYAGALLKIIN